MEVQRLMGVAARMVRALVRGVATSNAARVRRARVMLRLREGARCEASGGSGVVGSR